MQGLLGKKLGMTQVYDAQGRHVAVTAIELGPCTVLQRKTVASDGYEAVQLGFSDCREKVTTKPEASHCKKAGATPKRHVREFKLDAGDDPKVGEAVTVAAVFENIPFVDVTAVTKGRGFQGVVKRHRMAGGPMTHGGHSKRRIGAIGQRTTPGTVAKNHRLPGHMGNVVVTQQNLRVVELRGEQNLLLVRGAVPGPTGGLVIVQKAVKKKAVVAS